jgi:hypothetical protein
MKQVDDHRWVHFDPDMLVGQSCDDVDIAAVEENSHRIIVAALRVEDLFVKIISAYIKCADIERQKFFAQELLLTSWCTFAVKRDVALKIIEREKILSGKAKDKLAKQLAQLVRYRNAFAHGRLSYNKEGRLTIQYFSGRERCDLIDDAFWDGISSDINLQIETLLAVWAHLRDQ